MEGWRGWMDKRMSLQDGGVHRVVVSLPPGCPRPAPASSSLNFSCCAGPGASASAVNNVVLVGLGWEEEDHTLQRPVCTQLWGGPLGGWGKASQQGELTIYRHGAFL